MSRFWAGDSASESESESEEEQIVNQKVQTTGGGGRFGASYDESDSDSEGEVRVVKSQTDRALDSIRDKVNKIATCRKTNNWSLLQDEFEAANKMIEMKKMVIMKTGMPKFYIKMLGDVEDFVTSTLKNKEALKKMKESVVRDINRMKLTVKKHNTKYEKEILDFRAHPENYAETEEEEEEDSSDDDDDENSDEDEDSDDDDEDESDDEEVAKPKTSAAKAKVSRKALDSDDSDDESWDEDDDDDDEEDSESEKENELKGRARWLKKAVVSKPTEKVEKKQSSAAAAASRLKKSERELKKEEKERGGGGTGVSGSAAVWTAEDEMKEDVFNKKLAELLASRGRKGTDPRELLMKLEVLAKISQKFGVRKEIQLLMHLISSMYDTYSRNIDDFMELQQWRTCSRCLQRITNLLSIHKSLVLAITPADDVTDIMLGSMMSKKRTMGVNGELLTATDGDDTTVTGTAAGVTADEGKGPLKIVGSLEAHILRLHDEYNKALQQINPHTQEYVIRLSDEAVLIELADAIYQYYVRVNEPKSAAVVALLNCEHMYYKHDIIASAVQRAHIFNKTYGKHADIHPASMGGKSLTSTSSAARDVTHIHPASFLGAPVVETPVQDNTAKLAHFCQYIFKHGDERAKTRALLFSVYHHSLHDRYHTARDLFLMSHIQDGIDKVEPSTQILYNRALVTLGLCAFRLGLIQKAYDCLAGICSGRVKELLAQGQIMRYHDRDPEQEKLERRRQMPYHMHINPDLLESAHMICAMFLELPNFAKAAAANNSSVITAVSSHNVISKAFRKYMQSYNRQLFNGPPENIREHVLAATKYLLAGEWKKASDIIIGLEVWNLIPADGGNKVKELLTIKIKEDAVKTYLLTYGQHYKSISIQYLATMFELTPAVVKKLISKMIYAKEFNAALDQSCDMVVLHSVDVTALQTLTQQIADKMSILVESNERLIDPILNVYNFNPKDDWGRGTNEGGGGRRDYYEGGGRGGGGGGGDRRRFTGAGGFRGVRPGGASSGTSRSGGYQQSGSRTGGKSSGSGAGGYKKRENVSGSSGSSTSSVSNPWGQKNKTG